ncbi:MAG: GldG family protein [Oceanococcus sp.]
MQNKALNRSSLLVIAIALLAIVSLSQLLFKGWRLDLTENNLYTLSDGTRNVLNKIEEPITLYYFYNRDAVKGVPQLQAYATRVQEFLEELNLHAGDKLQLKLIAPEAFSTEEDRAVELGVQSVPVNEQGDKLYFGLAGTNSVDDVATIPFFQPNRENLLEYDVAKLIYGLAHPVKPKVGLISSLEVNGSFNRQTMQQTPGWMAITQLKEFFDIEDLSTDAESFADDIELLLLIHPVNLPQSTLYAIDQFVLKGGNALVFVDPYAESAAQGGMTAMSEGPGPNSNLEPLLKAWGVNLTGDVLGDGAAALQVQQGPEQAPTYHIALLGFDNNHVASDDAVTQQLESLNFGYTGILQASEAASTTFTPLVFSSDRSAPIPAFKIQPNTKPQQLLSGFEPTGETYAIAARVHGRASSAYGELPPEGIDNPAHQIESVQDINVIVVADTDVLTDRYWVQVQNFLGQQIASPFAGNGDLLVNAVDNLLGSSDVIGIKGRAGYSRPFTLVEDMKREADARFRQTEEGLQAKLRETETKLSELQAQNNEGNLLTLSPEQQAEVELFRDEQLKTRKALREVRHNLNKDIDRLEATLKFVNIGLVPLLLLLLALLMGLTRRSGGRA